MGFPSVLGVAFALGMLLGGGAVAGVRTDTPSPALARPPAPHVHMPVLAGGAAPVVALYSDFTQVHGAAEWRREPYPVGVAVWLDGTVVRSNDDGGWRVPYVVGRVAETSVTELLDTAGEMGWFDADWATARPEPDTAPSVISLVAGGRAVTFARPSRKAPPLTPSRQADWERMTGLLTTLAGSATPITTRTLAFDLRCVSVRDSVKSDRLPGEVRAVLAPNPFMETSPEKQDRMIEGLRAAGFNTLCINTQWRQWVQYPDSRFRPQAPGVGARNSRVVDTLISAAHRRGMRVEAFAEYGFYASNSKDSTESVGWLRQFPHLAAIDKHGRDYLHTRQDGYFKLLCPANPESHRLLTELCLEMLETYPFDGIHLERIRYPNADFCYCAYCRRRFAEDTGTTLAVFAGGSAEWDTWMKWRQARVTDFLRPFSKEVRARFPDRSITIGGAYPDDLGKRGQEWPLWLEEGLVDAAAPLLYDGRHVPLGMEALRKLMPDHSRVIYGLLSVDGVGGDICTMRRAGGRGYCVWHTGTLLPAARDAFEAANTPFGPAPAMLLEVRP